MPYTIESVVAELRRLLAMPAADKASLGAWYEEARKLEEVLATPGPSIAHFHFIMHYLIDADVRLKDPAYREYQENKLRSILVELSEGRA